MQNIHHFDFGAFYKIFHAYVDEMYPLEKGIFIIDPDKDFRIGDGMLTRKQIKHIVEQRKAEGKSADEIKEIIDHIPSVIFAADFELSNRNPKYPGSVMRFKYFQEWEKGLAVVMDQKKGAVRKVITAHLYSSKKILLLRKKLNTSAAGETPNPPIERHPYER